MAVRLKAKKKEQAIKSTAPFYHQQLNGSGEQRSIIPVVLLQAGFLHCQKACCFCCCWQIDLQANAEVLFFKGHYLSSSEQGARCMGTRLQEIIPHVKKKWRKFLFLISVWFFDFFLSGASEMCLTAKKPTGSPAEEDQYLNSAVVGQHVGVYKIKWGLKLISNSPWKSLQVSWDETERWSRAMQSRWPPPRLLHIIIFVSPN